MLKLVLTAVVLGLLAGSACAEPTLVVDEMHHATAPIKAKKIAPTAQKQLRQPAAKVYLLENRARSDHASKANETKHNADNW